MMKIGDAYPKDVSRTCPKGVAVLLLTKRKVSAYSSFWKVMEASYKATEIDRFTDRTAVEIR